MVSHYKVVNKQVVASVYEKRLKSNSKPVIPVWWSHKHKKYVHHVPLLDEPTLRWTKISTQALCVSTILAFDRAGIKLGSAKSRNLRIETVEAYSPDGKIIGTFKIDLNEIKDWLKPVDDESMIDFQLSNAVKDLW